MIRKEGDKYVIKSKDGSKNLGEYATEEEAKKRLKQIEFFKALKNHPDLKRKAK